jgi:hypothetical protein
MVMGEYVGFVRYLFVDLDSVSGTLVIPIIYLDTFYYTFKLLFLSKLRMRGEEKEMRTQFLAGMLSETISLMRSLHIREAGI